MAGFEVGEVVMLKSGGPKMTYEGEEMPGQAVCSWFEKTKKITDTFKESSLMKWTPIAPPTVNLRRG